jgi:hypothetical protein
MQGGELHSVGGRDRPLQACTKTTIPMQNYRKRMNTTPELRASHKYIKTHFKVQIWISAVQILTLRGRRHLLFNADSNAKRSVQTKLCMVKSIRLTMRTWNTSIYVAYLGTPSPGARQC